MNLNLFWSLSAGEAEQMIGAINKNKLETLRRETSITWKLGNLIAIAFNDPKKYPTLQAAFPGLYEDKNKEEKEILPKQTDWRIMQARMAYYAHAKNMNLKAGEKNDG